MWAWHRVDRLLKEADAGGSRTSVIDEIVRLGEGYSIATEYTSFIVLENDAEFQRWKIDRKNALRIEPRSSCAGEARRSAGKNARKSDGRARAGGCEGGGGRRGEATGGAGAEHVAAERCVAEPMHRVDRARAAATSTSPVAAVAGRSIRSAA